MLVLTLAAAARASELTGFVGGSAGKQALPALGTVFTNGTFARIEAGLGPPRFQGYLLVQIATHGAPEFSELTAGDFLHTQVGAGARIPLPVGPLRFAARAELGLSSLDTNVDVDVMREYGPFAAGPHALGPFLQAGGDVGFDIIPDAVTLHLSPDVGYVVVDGIGLMLEMRIGLFARL